MGPHEIHAHVSGLHEHHAELQGQLADFRARRRNVRRAIVALVLELGGHLVSVARLRVR